MQRSKQPSLGAAFLVAFFCWTSVTALSEPDCSKLGGAAFETSEPPVMRSKVLTVTARTLIEPSISNNKKKRH
jgi:hypothetical protein